MTQTTIQIKEPKAPATPAQISYLESLIIKNECPTVAERYAFAKGFLTKGAASTLIDEAKKAPVKKAQPQTTQQFVVAAQQLGTPAEPVGLTELPAFGYYNLDGTIYYWDCTGKDVKPVLRKLSIVEVYSYATQSYAKKGKWTKVFGTSNVGGKAQAVSATYVPYAGKGWNTSPVKASVWVPGVLVTAVTGGAQPLSEAAAGKLGKQFGFCIRCGATLTDPVSVANGIGPVCAKYWA